MTQQIKDLIQQIKASFSAIQKAEDSQKSVKSEIMSAWREIRKLLWQVEQMGGYEALMYKSFRQFCVAEISDSGRACFSSELAAAFYEFYVFDIPVGTYQRNWFNSSGIRKHFPIRKQVSFEKWQLDDELVERCLKVWQSAQSIASKYGRELPSISDMKEAIAQSNGEPVIRRSAADEIASLEERLEQMEQRLLVLREENQQLRQGAKVTVAKSRILGQEEALEIIGLITNTCRSLIQEQQAYRLLLLRGKPACMEYLQGIKMRAIA